MGTLLLFLAVIGVLIYEHIKKRKVQKHIDRINAMQASLRKDRKDD